MLGLARFAVRVEVFRNCADFGLERVGAIGEWERVEAAGFDVYAIVANAQPAACRMAHVT